MHAIKSLNDLTCVKQEALEQRRAEMSRVRARISVAMGTCGIAVGARETFKAIRDTIEADGLSDVIVTQTGCMGMCSSEPVVIVQRGEQSRVIYGKVSPERARHILKEHIENGRIVEDALVIP